MRRAGHGGAGGLAAAVAVARRDLLEFVRDRRTLCIALLMPMAMYPLIALMSTLGARTAIEDLEARTAPRRLALAVSGADAEPFVSLLRAAVDVAAQRPHPLWPAEVVLETVAEAEGPASLESGRSDVWLHVGPGTAQDLEGQGTVRLTAQVPQGRALDNRIRDHFEAVMRAAAAEARSRRVARAGLAATTLEPLAVELAGGGQETDPAGGGLVATVAGAVLVLLTLLTATGAFYPAIDAIAGEKERGTIETLLVAPCRRRDIVFGKYLAVLAVTLATLAANAVSITLTAAVLLRTLPPDGRLGASPAGITACAAVALVACLGLASVAAALCLAVTAAARSVKEAQNTLTPVVLLVSGLAGIGLLPGLAATPLAAVPFAGQVAISRAALGPGVDAEPWSWAWLAVGRLAISLASSGLVTWLLLRATTAALRDEEILFRGPDAAATRRWRPAPRSVPSPAQGVAAVAIGLAGLWYAQGLSPTDLARAIPVQQAMATLLPLAILAAWQRIDVAATFKLRWPAGTPGRGLACLAAAAVAGGSLFLVGAAALLATRGTQLSPAARELAERIMELFNTAPGWLSWLLIAALPAVCEEILFRGWLLAALAGHRPVPGRVFAAVVIQAACFAAFHLLPERMPQTFVLGLVLGWLTLRCGSILPAVLAHLAHNSVLLGLYAFSADAAAAGQATAATPGLPPAVLGGAVGCLALSAAVVWMTTGSAGMSVRD